MLEIKNIVVGALQTNCYLLYQKGEMVVIDPGGDAEKIISEIKKIGVSPKYIINTHGHPDHIMANEEIRKNTGAEIIRELKEGEKIRVGEASLEILHAPGHTKDSFCLKGSNFLIGGDVLFADGYGRTDLPGGSEEEMKETIEKLKKELPADTVVYPGHGEKFSIKDHFLF